MKPSEFLYISVIIVIIFLLTERVKNNWKLAEEAVFLISVQRTWEPRTVLVVRKQFILPRMQLDKGAAATRAERFVPRYTGKAIK